MTPVAPVEPVAPVAPAGPALPKLPPTLIFHEAIVPEPPVLSTFKVKLVPEYAVIVPSTKFVEVAELTILARSPTIYAKPLWVVNTFEPVPMVMLVVDVPP